MLTNGTDIDIQKGLITRVSLVGDEESVMPLFKIIGIKIPKFRFQFKIIEDNTTGHYLLTIPKDLPEFERAQLITILRGSQKLTAVPY